jgi:hypothetical protein
MVAVETGQLSPMVVGDVYCSVLEGCQELFDLRRARQWTDVLTSWCATRSAVGPRRLGGLRPFSTGATYVNFQTADEGDDRVRATYGANYDRLVEVKRRYDPDNLFQGNRNIRP